MQDLWKKFEETLAREILAREVELYGGLDDHGNLLSRIVCGSPPAPKLTKEQATEYARGATALLRKAGFTLAEGAGDPVAEHDGLKAHEVALRALTCAYAGGNPERVDLEALRRDGVRSNFHDVLFREVAGETFFQLSSGYRPIRVVVNQGDGGR